MKQWFVVHTQPLKETYAEKNLNQQGFETYLPLFQKTIKHARKVEDVVRPLFPRYIFVEMDASKVAWRSINGTYGVMYLLTNDNAPIPVRNNVIELLKRESNELGAVHLSALAHFAKGDRLYIKDGAFAGHEALFNGLDDKKRVQILLNFMGREMHLRVPEYFVEAA